MPKQRARTQPKLRVVSDQEKRSLTFKVEPLFVIAGELPSLFQQHWRELGRDQKEVPLDPNWEAMVSLNVQGLLHVMTARDDGKLVGYIFTLVGPHLHYKSTRHGNVDMYWMLPEYRQGWTALKFFNAHLDEMEKLKVRRVTIAENLIYKNARGRRTRILFQRLGYRAADIAFRIVLGE